NLPSGSTGADYMYMWTRVLEGRNGLEEDVDIFYFVGPSDYAIFFLLNGDGDLERIEGYFDDRLAHDLELEKVVDLGKVDKRSFRNYYGLRASVSFSYGSHDEWNIARLLNERRRGAADLGIASQIPVLFDGHPVPPGDYEQAIAAG